MTDIAGVQDIQPEFAFDFRLTGVGWAEGRIADRVSSATFTASYLGDALGDLLQALVELLSGAENSRCSWEEEPGEVRWIFDRSDGSIRLRILSFDDRWSDEADEIGTLIFQTFQPLATLGRAIAGAAETVLDTYGEAGYLERWRKFPFPAAQLGSVRDGIASLG